MMNSQDCIQDIDLLWDRHLTVRSAFPYFRPSDVGRSEKRSASFYRVHGKDVTLRFPGPITVGDVDRLNDAGYWVNQSLVIWMWALLEYHGVVGNAIKLDPARAGFEDVNILRRLRKVFAHTNGRYNPSDKDDVTLFDTMVERYRMGIVDRERFNLQIDEVLKPMIEGVKAYVRASCA
jgi:hypothetical protein